MMRKHSLNMLLYTCSRLEVSGISVYLTVNPCLIRGGQLEGLTEGVA